MPIPIPSTLGMLEDNLSRRRSVLPISRRKAVGWARGLRLPRGGPTVLYTGQMFQLVPGINSMTARLAGMEDSWMADYFGLARRINRWVNLAGALGRGRREEVREYSEYLRNIVRLLRAAEVGFGYLYEDDLYAGALAHDEGLDETLRAHAEHVWSRIRRHGVREVITVDPHTTYLLRTVYPTLLPGYSLRVRTYLEVLAENAPRLVERLDEEVTVHDSCLYARTEGVVEPPRALLRRGGVRIREAGFSKELTQCCGGPIEMLFPGRSNAVAAKRVAQLAACSNKIVTLCPLCLANLRRAAPAGVEVADVSRYLARAYAPAPALAETARPNEPRAVPEELPA